MTLDTLIMLSGALVAVLPFLGFPNSWDNVIFFLAGVFVIALGITVRRRGSGNGRTQEPRRSVSPERDAEINRTLDIE